MQNVYNIYGVFRPELVVAVALDSMANIVALEQEWLDKHYGQTGCVNTCKSAIGVMTGRKMSEAVKAKMRGRHPSDETRKKLSEAKLGHSVSDTTRERLSLVLRGKRRPDNVARNRSKTGWKHTDSARGKIAEAGKRECPDEVRNRISVTHKKLGTVPPGFSGRKHTEETLLKLSVAATGRKHSDESRKRRSDEMKVVWALRKGGKLS